MGEPALASPAVDLDRTRHGLRLATGERLGYDKLLLAAGCGPVGGGEGA